MAATPHVAKTDKQGQKEIKMKIKKTTRPAWQTIYGAYRALKKIEREERWEEHRAAHDKWLDSLDVLRAVVQPDKSLSIQPDVLCRYALDKDTYGINAYTPKEQLKARLLRYSEQKAAKAAAEERAKFDWDNIDTSAQVCNTGFFDAAIFAQNAECTEREWACKGCYDNMAYDIDAGLSAYQMVELINRGEFEFSFFGHSRGYEVERKLP